MSDETNTDIATLGVSEIDERTREIVRLAHTGKIADETQYQRLQPRLIALSARREALVRGSGAAAPAAAEPQRAVATRGEGAPPTWYDYPRLPDAPQVFDDTDRSAWDKMLRVMHKAGLTTRQVTALAEAVEEVNKQAIEERAAAAGSIKDSRQRETEGILRSRYGAGWRQRLADANRALTVARRHDRSVRVGDMALSDGTRVGDHAAYVSMLIDLTETM